MGSGMVGNKHAPIAAIRTNKEVSKPKVGNRRRLHLDLLGSVEENRHNLLKLSEDLGFLEKLRDERPRLGMLGMERHSGEAPLSDTKISLSLSSEHEYLAKFAEMMGHPLSYQITRISPKHAADDSYDTAREIIRRLGLHMVETGSAMHTIDVEIPGRAAIRFSSPGIIHSSSNKLLLGRECLEYIACNVHEDLAAVIQKEGRLVYDFDSSMFEKTPKNPRTGKNRYVGKNWMKFHGAAKTFGKILPDIFRKLMAAFSESRLDVLTIDLRGGNVYTDGHTEIRRFERDHVVPIRNQSIISGEGGILAFADVFFQPEGEELSPFEGGAYLDIDCPIEFHAKYKLKETKGGAR